MFFVGGRWIPHPMEKQSRSVKLFSQLVRVSGITEYLNITDNEVIWRIPKTCNISCFLNDQSLESNEHYVLSPFNPHVFKIFFMCLLLLLSLYLVPSTYPKMWMTHSFQSIIKLFNKNLNKRILYTSSVFFFVLSITANLNRLNTVNFFTLLQTELNVSSWDTDSTSIMGLSPWKADHLALAWVCLYRKMPSHDQSE